jgi:Tfp pilus assembly protein PilF
MHSFRISHLVALLVLSAVSNAALHAVQSSVPGKRPTATAAAANQQFRLAVSHYQTGQYRLAAQELESLVRRMPPSFEVQELLGLVYSSESQDAKARVHFEAAVRLEPGSAAAKANLAINLSRLGDNIGATEEFRRALQLEPKRYDANHDFGEFYIRAGNIAAAIPYLAAAERARPQSYANGYDLALAYVRMRQWSAARGSILNLMAGHNTAELHNLLAEADEGSGDFISAVNEYQIAAHMNPSDTNIFDWGGEFLLHHNWDAAVKVFSQGVKLYPNSARQSVGLGLALYRKGSFDQAVKILVKATDLDPSDPGAYYFLNECDRHSPADADVVIERFKRLAELRPRDPNALYFYAESLWKTKQVPLTQASLIQVERLLQECLALEPGFADGHYQLANLYSQRQEYAKAVPEYERTLALDAKNGRARYRLGQTYSHLGERALAQKQFAIYQQWYTRHLAEEDKEGNSIRTFVLSEGGAQTASHPAQ